MLWWAGKSARWGLDPGSGSWALGWAVARVIGLATESGSRKPSKEVLAEGPWAASILEPILAVGLVGEAKQAAKSKHEDQLKLLFWASRGLWHKLVVSVH